MLIFNPLCFLKLCRAIFFNYALPYLPHPYIGNPVGFSVAVAILVVICFVLAVMIVILVIVAWWKLSGKFATLLILNECTYF